MGKKKETEKKNESLGDYCRVEVIAQLFNVTARRIQQLTQDGVIKTVTTSDGKRYETIPTIQQYIKYLADKAYGKSRSDKTTELQEKKLKADIALKESQGELHRLKTEIQAGKYLSVEEIKLDYSRFFVSFKKFAMSIPNRLAGRLSGFVDPVEVRQIEKEMQKEVTKLLSSFVVSATIDEKVKDANGKTKD